MTQSPIQQQTIQLVATNSKTEKLEEMLTPFALDETLIRHLDKGKKTGHSFTSGRLKISWFLGWQIQKCLILNKGLKELHAHGFTPVVRQAGGLAVKVTEAS